MASITDKFGRPSATTSYAKPTTVRAARLAGETTLSAYDLSGYDDTTPLYFVTYRKTTEVNPDTGLQEEKIVNQVSFKGIVSLDNNTITDLEVSPGYSDLGNEVGDYIESVPTSHWGNDLVGGLLVSHNPDGTLAANSVNTAALANNSVATAKIANGAVVPAKLGLPGCLVLRSSQNVTSNTSTSTISFNSSPFNKGSMYSSGSPTRVTASVGGLYQVSASIVWGATQDGGRRTFQVRVNGSVVASDEELVAMNFVIGQSISLMANLAPGDYIDVQVAQTSGATLSATQVRLGVALINA